MSFSINKAISCVFLIATTTTFSQTKLQATATMAHLSGVVTNMSNKVLPNESVILLNEKTKKEYKTITDEKGKFELLVPVGSTYSLRYKSFTADKEYTKMQIPPT